MFKIFLYKIYYGTVGKVTCKHPEIMLILVKQMTFVPVLGSELELGINF